MYIYTCIYIYRPYVCVCIYMSILFQYLTDLSYPHDKNNNVLIIDWLLGLAVRLTYSDNAEKYR